MEMINAEQLYTLYNISDIEKIPLENIRQKALEMFGTYNLQQLTYKEAKELINELD